MKRHYSKLLCGAAAVAILSGAGVAHAEDRAQVRFDIPSQPLTSALNEFGIQSGSAVLFKADVTGQKLSRAFSGASDPETALMAMLDGTGLSYRREGQAFVIVGASDPQSGSAAGDGAEGTVQALIVTAQKREEDIQDVPIAISAFTQEDLTRSQVAGGPDLMTQVPNFTFTKTNFSGYSIQIRGIGTQAVSATVDPAVAVAFNNTPFIRNRFFEQEFYDLERIEVLRGPQGTLYGRNATAGVVNIISAKPKFNFEAKASADISNYSSSRLEGMLNLPLVDGRAALRIAGAWTKRDGYVKNTLTGDQIDGRDLWSARVSLRVDPTDWLSANLIYEHFDENDDRLRTGKQVCNKDPGPVSVSGIEVFNGVDIVGADMARSYWTQGCLPASMYSPDSYQTPNSYALPYGPTASLLGAPVDPILDTYESAYQSRNLREIETRIAPEYTASTDTVELQLQFQLPNNLTLTSETGFNKDRIFSFQDFNRFSTRAGTLTVPGGVYCDPQLGCSDRLMAADISTARSQQFSQELRLSSDYDGPFNFSLGANFLRYDTEDKYYVIINTVNALTDNTAYGSFPDTPQGFVWSGLGRAYQVNSQTPRQSLWVDRSDIHHLTDEGRNYFLSKNPFGLRSYAVFGEAYYNVTDNLKVTAGLRWTVDQKTAPQIPSWLLALNSYGLPTLRTIRQEWREPTGRLAIDWKPDLSFTDETLLYASYVHGYKAGGANPPPFVPVFPPIGGLSGTDPFGSAFVQSSVTKPATFKPEFVDAYELGTKNSLLDGKLTLNLNGFYYDYTGYQISQIVDRSAVNMNFDAKIWGSELEIAFRPLENLRLGFKGGYENTRLADGSKAIDLMDRTAGDPNWIVRKPFPTFTSNCIVPKDVAIYVACQGYFTPQLDAYTLLPYVPNPTMMTYSGDPNLAIPIELPYGPYPGFDTRTAPNNGEGIFKDLSGNELPNAPHYTATITADLTLPLPRDWLVTLHTDLYYQSEAWTRIFNTEGYDKLKAYNNINFAAIFTNEDAGWTVMAYVKNVLDKDNITGSFLNSDDTGLTTNVFLNEPRLYGLRVTKNWSGSEWWSAHANKGGYYPYRLELDGDYSRVSGGREILVPQGAELYPADQPSPLGVQNNLDGAAAGGLKFTWQPQPSGWRTSASVRYVRAGGGAEDHRKQDVSGGYFTHRFHHSPFPPYAKLYVYPSQFNLYSYATTEAKNSESHVMADFLIGKDFGLGTWGLPITSGLDFGIGYAKLDSDSSATLHGRPDLTFPADDVYKYGAHFHRFSAQIDAHREFQGAGPEVAWNGSARLLGADDAAGRLDLDVGLGGAVLWGKQRAGVTGNTHIEYQTDFYSFKWLSEGPQIQDSQDVVLDSHRSTSATVPALNASLGLSYTVGGLKLGGGYRWERYFDAIDAGIAEHKTYDRTFDGPYFKVSVGFGG